MIWNEITKAYPDKWVAVANLIMDGDSPDILEGDIVAVKNDDDIDSYELNHHDKGYKYRRTTEGFLMELQDQVLRFPFAVDEIKKRGGQVKATCSYAKIKNGEILRD